MAKKDNNERNNALDNEFVFSNKSEKEKSEVDPLDHREGIDEDKEEHFLQNIFLKSGDGSTVLDQTEKQGYQGFNSDSSLGEAQKAEMDLKAQSRIEELENSAIKADTNELNTPETEFKTALVEPEPDINAIRSNRIVFDDLSRPEADQLNIQNNGGEQFNFTNEVPQQEGLQESEGQGVDVNAAPTDISLTSHTVDENASEGTVVATLSAIDSDAGEFFSYSIEENSNFEIVANQIKVKAGATLDFESAESHDIDITVTDSAGNRYIETISIAVNDINEAPVAVDDSAADNGSGELQTDEDRALTIKVSDLLVNDSDVDGDKLSLSSVQAAEHGSVAIDGDGNVVFTPDDNYHGEAAFSYTVSDGKGGKDTATVTLNVDSVNDIPVINVVNTITVDEGDASISGQLTSSDVDDGATATFSVSDGSAAPDGFTLNKDGSYSFDPTDEAYNHLSVGDSSVLKIPITVTDDNGATDSTQIEITIQGTNDAVIASDVTIVNHNISFDGPGDYVQIGNSSDIFEGRSEFTLSMDFNFSNMESTNAYTTLVSDWDSSGQSMYLGINSQDKFFYIEKDESTGAFKSFFSDNPVDMSSPHSVSLVKDGASVKIYLDGESFASSDSMANSLSTTNGTEITLGQLNYGGRELYSSEGTFDQFQVFDSALDQADIEILSAGGTPSADRVVMLDFEGSDPLADKSGNGHDASFGGDAEVVNTPIMWEDKTLIITPEMLLSNDIDIDDDLLNVTKVTATADTHGDVSIDADGNIIFVPDQDYNGDISFEYTVSDQHGSSDTATASMSVGSVNDAPVITTAISASVDEGDASISGQLSSTDVDDGATASFAITEGSRAPDGFSLNSDGSYSFDPDHAAYNHLNVGDSTVLTIPVTVTDDQGATDTSQIQITITGTHDAPVAGAAVIASVDEGDASISGQMISSNVDDGATATYSISEGSTSPDGFTLSKDGSYLFDPSDEAYDHLNVGDSTVLTIPVTVTDDQGAIDTSRIQITITGTNDVPVAGADVIASVDEGGAGISGQLSSTDLDYGATASFTVTEGSSAPDGFNLNSDGSYSFNPADGAYDHLKVGDSTVLKIPVTVTDDQGATDTNQVQITVTGTNDTPVVGKVDLGSIEEDTGIKFSADKLLANSSDVDGDSLSVVDVSVDAQYGTVEFSTDKAGNVETVKFIPAEDYHGEDVPLNFVASDGHEKVEGTATIDVTAVNDGPVAVDDSDSVQSAGDILVSENFDEGVSGWSNGSLSHDALNITGDLISNKTETITSKVFDLGAGHAGETVVITFDLHGYQDDYSNEHDGGWERDGVYEDEFNVFVNGAEISSDKFGDGRSDINHSYSIEAIVDENGQIELGLGFETSSTAREFANIDNLKITVGDNWSGGLETDEDSALTINASDLLANDTDVDGDTLSISAVSATNETHGKVDIDNDGNIVFTPETDYNGEASFEYTISDGKGGTDTATVSLNVDAVNDQPVITVVDTTVTEDVSQVIATAEDLDGSIDSSTLSAEHGTVKIDDKGNISYTPDADYNGADTVSLSITDDGGATTTQTINLTIDPTQDNPVAVDDNKVTEINHAMSFDGRGDYISTDINRAQDFDKEQGSTFEFTITYEGDPNAGYQVMLGSNNGEFAIFKDRGNNSFGIQEDYGSNRVSVNQTNIDAFDGEEHHIVYVQQGNQRIVYIDGQEQLNFTSTVEMADSTINIGGEVNGQFPFTGNIDGVKFYNTALEAEEVQNLADGESISTDNLIAHYSFEGDTPLSDKSGNGHDATAHGDVHTIESGTNEVSMETKEDTSLTLTAESLLANDTDADGDVLSISAVSATDETHGTVEIDDKGNITFTPEENYNGEASFEYTISDGKGGTDTATVSLNVDAVNDQPVISVVDTRVTEDVSQVIAIAEDLDGSIDSSTLSAEHGTVAIDDKGNISYTPDADYNGADTVSLSITDDGGATTTQKIKLTIDPTQDNPVAVDDGENHSVELTDTNTSNITVADSKSINLNGSEDFSLTVSVTPEGEQGSYDIIFNKENAVELAFNGDGNLMFAMRTEDEAWTWHQTDLAYDTDSINTIQFSYDGKNVTISNTDSNGETDSYTQSYTGGVVDGGNDLMIGNRPYGNGRYSMDGEVDNVSMSVDGTEVIHLEFDGVNQLADSSGHGNDAVLGDGASLVEGNNNFGTTEDTSLTINPAELLSNDTDVDGDALTISNVNATGDTHGTVELVNKIAFEDDFNDNSSDGWVEISFNGRDIGNWDSSSSNIGEQSNSARGIFAHEMGGNAISTDYTVSVDINANTGNTYNNGVGLVFSFEDSSNYYQASWDDYSTSYDDSSHHKDFNLIKVENGIKTVIETIDGAELPNEFNLSINVSENGISVEVDGNEMLTSVDQPPLGTIGLWTADNDHGVSYDNIVVQSDTAGQEIIFTPEENYNGEASFEYTISDGKGGTDTATVSLNVDAVNDSAVVGNVDLGAIKEDTGIKFSAKELLGNSTDADGDTLQVVDVSVDEKFGTVEFSTDKEGNIETVKFTPVADYSGDDVPLNFVVSDGHEKVEGTASIDVTAVGDEPVINEIRGTSQSETLNGTDKADHIWGERGNDTINAGDGDDIIEGGDGYDTLNGGAGNDTFIQNEGDDYDVFKGGEGTDTVTRGTGDGNIGLRGNFGAENSIEEIDAKGNDIFGDTNSNTLDFSSTKLTDVGEINGGRGNDNITGTAGDDTIIGGDGYDTLQGGAGDDTFIQNEGDDYDVFKGGEGTDTVTRGTGDGNIGLKGNFGAENSIEEIDAKGNDIFGDTNSNTLDFSSTKLTNVGEINGGGGNDNIIGTDGDDTIIGGDGHDTLKGGAGNDNLRGEEGNDKLDGGRGDDLLTGGQGDDVAFGGEGNDSYFFNAFDGQDTFHGGEGWTDTINLSEANSADPDAPWTITVDGEQVAPTDGESFINFEEDTSGVVSMADGSTLTFDGVERVEW